VNIQQTVYKSSQTGELLYTNVAVISDFIQSLVVSNKLYEILSDSFDLVLISKRDLQRSTY